MAIYGIQKQIYSRIEELETFPCSVKAQTMDPTLLHDRLQKKYCRIANPLRLGRRIEKASCHLAILKTQNNTFSSTAQNRTLEKRNARCTAV